MLRSSLHRHRGRRGSVLLFVVVLISIMTFMGLIMLKRASTEGDAVASKRRYDQSVSCVDAAREMLNSKFRAYGMTPTSLTLDTTLDDARMATGHYTSIAVASVDTAEGLGTTTLGVSDASNRIARLSLGGQAYRMTVVCTAGGGGGAPVQQNEVEFLVRFGL